MYSSFQRFKLLSKYSSIFNTYHYYVFLSHIESQFAYFRLLEMCRMQQKKVLKKYLHRNFISNYLLLDIIPE